MASKKAKPLRFYLQQIHEIILFLLILTLFFYSGYKIAVHLRLLPKNVFGANCQDCSSCRENNWCSELCQNLRDWCQDFCPPKPTPTPSLPAEPSPTVPVPSPTTELPTPTQIITPSPTATPTEVSGELTPTGGLLPTTTLTSQPTVTSGPQEGGGGPSDGGGGPASPCVPPEAPKAPTLLSATPVSATQVKLSWTSVERADHYSLAYGLSSGKYLYGNADLGKVTEYTVSGLTEGTTYYFVVAAAISGDCPVSSPFSNEVSSKTGVSGVLGAREVGLEEEKEELPEGQLGGGEATQAGEVAGTRVREACPFWWIVLIGQTIILTGLNLFWLKIKERPRFWWLRPPILVVLAYLIDRYAHTHWYVPSKMCPFEPWLGSGLAILETAGFKILKKSPELEETKTLDSLTRTKQIGKIVTGRRRQRR